MSIESLTLRFTNPAQQLVGSQEIPLASIQQPGSKSVAITNAGILAALNTQPAGTIFTPSIIATYGNDESGNPITSVTSPASNIPSFVPRVISLASVINKTINDAPFNLSSLITTISAGVLSYSSSNTSVASVNSSGQVTLLTEGTTTITINVTATAEHMAGSTSTTLNVTTPPRWRQLGADIDGITFEEQSGSSVSLSSNGRILAIGAPSNGYNLSEGRARIFDLNTNVTPNQWIQRGLDIVGTAYGEQSGSSVSISSDGNSVAIGAPSTGHGYNGIVRVYYWNTAVTPNVWTLRGQAMVITGGNGNNAGNSVSLSSDGNIVAFGSSYQDDSVYGGDCGKTYVYEWNSALSNWVQRGTDISGLGTAENSGWSVSLSSDGNTLAIGAKFLGQARVYDWDTTSSDWEQRGSNVGVAAVTGLDQLTSVSLSSSNGNTLAIGNGIRRKVRVYDWNTDSYNWEQRGTINAPDGDGIFGSSVYLSSDGNSIAIGSPESDGYKGRVRVYDWNTTISPNAWTQRGLVITGEANNDVSGRAINLSSDGNTLAIGATQNTGAGSRKGHVRVYNYY